METHSTKSKKPCDWDVENQHILSPIERERPEKELSETKFDLREHTIDVCIAILYVTSGLPFLSQKAQNATDLTASSLWLFDSSTLLFFTLRKFFKLRRQQTN
ncbi:MAG: hypothetical protein US13_C0001G0032 [candidate division TM6 bacterium GW2011_GWE2_36_25]|nr:MAG: hypothetical protein US03_C0001G0172 [candidate division TM6 bacterium GW2011_GWF2_36_131]KKQ03692.1 MAG: hypothetical protein US13_C0001G0032 [candidate division TM6 bacterium GW2011_GWE2_36_25]